ncbi:MAG: hypothetical protein JWL87_453 [Candidatus Adlerbacteria bacterium]|nr:hypothetical protein [Candidatus Adlerbacteria bacterium]
MEIPFYRQENEGYCGPAVLQMALAALGTDLSQKELAEEAYTPLNDPDHGTEVADMVRVLEAHGARVQAQNGTALADVAAALEAGKIAVIAFTERHYGWGHYSIIKKIDATHVHLLDPDEDSGGEPMAREEFESRWQDPKHTKTDHWAAFVGA